MPFTPIAAIDSVAVNVERLRELFPAAFREGKVDFEVLRQLLGGTVEEREERYGLNWHGKRAARQLALIPSNGTLRPQQELSVDWDATQNLMIEGDNLEVLKLLQKPYAGKVKLIYIDPPYNTGKDFIYPDNFRDSIRDYLELTGQRGAGGQKLTTNPESSGRFHTDWLNMMYPRLFLARNLLREDGAIFVSIDDHEVANLRLLMDEIFGPENFVATVVWQKSYSPANDKKGIDAMHDFVLVYSRTQPLAVSLLPRSQKQDSAYSNPDDDPRGPWKAVDATRAEHRDYAYFPITTPSGKKVLPASGRSWVFNEDEVGPLMAANLLWFGKDGASKPSKKLFLTEVKQGVVPTTWWAHDDAGHNDEAKKEVKSAVSQGALFGTPKPTRLIRRMLQIAASPGPAVVLDFFAGSGSTMDAVFRQNAEDGQERRCILVQLPEPLEGGGKLGSIADICRERVRRAGEKVRGENPMFHGDLGFRAFRLDSSNIRAWDPEPSDIAGAVQESIEHLKADRTEEDILYELLLRLNLDLSLAIERRTIAGKMVYSAGAGTLLACLADDIQSSEVEALALGIAAWREELAPAGDSTAVFRDSGFGDDVAKSNCAAILAQNGFKEANLKSL